MTDRRTLADHAAGADPVGLERVDWHDPRAVALRAAMDDEIGPRYAGDVAEFDPDTLAAISSALSIDPADIVATLVASVDGVPVGHAALRRLGQEWELKRVVTLPAARGRGVSRALITEIERLVVEQGGTRLILQTGHRQPEAVRLYEWLGYRPIPVYPPYDAISFSHCYARDLV